MEVAVIAILVIVVVVVLLKSRSGSNKKPAAGSPPKRPVRKAAPKARSEPAASEDFPAVSIQFGANACQAVTELQGKRFLKGEVPKVPLDNCDSANCSCKYVHHEVRREHDEDRRVPSSLQTSLYDTTGKAERRTGGKRRRTDPK